MTFGKKAPGCDPFTMTIRNLSTNIRKKMHNCMASAKTKQNKTNQNRTNKRTNKKTKTKQNKTKNKQTRNKIKQNKTK